jgi:hypothetical protein
VHAEILKLSGAGPELGAVAPESRDILRDNDTELFATCGIEHGLITRAIRGSTRHALVLESCNNYETSRVRHSIAFAKLIINGSIALFVGTVPSIYRCFDHGLSFFRNLSFYFSRDLTMRGRVALKRRAPVGVIVRISLHARSRAIN